MESSFDQLVNNVQEWIRQESRGKADLIVENSRSKSVPVKIETFTKKENKAPKGLISSEDFDHIEVLLITQSQEPSLRTLCERLTSAIDTHIAKAKLIEAPFYENQNLWSDLHQALPRLRHVLASEVELYQWPNLLKHYERSPRRQLFGVPLFLLADLSSYLKDVELKKNLWTTLLSEI